MLTGLYSDVGCSEVLRCQSSKPAWTRRLKDMNVASPREANNSFSSTSDKLLPCSNIRGEEQTGVAGNCSFTLSVTTFGNRLFSAVQDKR